MKLDLIIILNKNSSELIVLFQQIFETYFRNFN